MGTTIRKINCSDDELLAMYQDKQMSIRAIAQHFGCSYQAVHQRLQSIENYEGRNMPEAWQARAERFGMTVLVPQEFSLPEGTINWLRSRPGTMAEHVRNALWEWQALPVGVRDQYRDEPQGTMVSTQYFIELNQKKWLDKSGNKSKELRLALAHYRKPG